MEDLQKQTPKVTALPKLTAPRKLEGIQRLAMGIFGFLCGCGCVVYVFHFGADVQALRELLKASRAGYDIGITRDVSRGPMSYMKAGAATLALRGGDSDFTFVV